VWRDQRLHGAGKAILIAFVTASFASVCPGFIFREHYFIAFLPALALLIGIAVSFAAQALEDRPSKRFLSYLLVVLFVGGAIQSFASNQDVFLSFPRPKLSCGTIAARCSLRRDKRGSISVRKLRPTHASLSSAPNRKFTSTPDAVPPRAICICIHWCKLILWPCECRNK
jgi:hypothetical protein